jgi:hypothetical protein
VKQELRSLWDENQQLKKLVANRSLDKKMLRSLIKKGMQLAGLRRNAKWGGRTPDISSGKLRHQCARSLQARPDPTIDVWTSRCVPG